MPKEIERKFLLHPDKWQQLSRSAGQHYRQGYLLTDPQKTIRVRATDTHGYITIKGPNTGATRDEYEYEIPVQEAKELLDKFAVSELSKVRYKIPFHGHIWEVDEFLGNNAGLMVAEIELASEDEQFDVPEWIAREVTGDERYYNSNLTLRPFKDWN